MWSFQFFFSHLPPFLYHEAVRWYCLTDKISTVPTQMILHEDIWFVCVWRQHWVSSGRALKSWILTLSVIWLLKSAVTIKQASDVVFMQMLGGFFPNSSRLFGPPPSSLCFITFIPWCLWGTVFIFYWVNRFPFVYDCNMSFTNIGHSSPDWVLIGFLTSDS